MKKECGRYQENQFFEGLISIRSVITAMSGEFSHNDRKIQKLYYAKEKLPEQEKTIKWLSHRAEEFSFEMIETTMDKISELAIGTTHGGFLAECSRRTLPVLNKQDIVKDGFYVLLEGIEDPYNFGYALRSIYAAGVDGVILTPRNWMSAAGVVCRSSAGASEQIPMYISENEQISDIFHDVGYKIVCATKENAVSAYDSSLSKPLLLVVGGEKRGISSTLLSKCDLRICLDYGRNYPMALSAASAASILSFEIFRQNRTK